MRAGGGRSAKRIRKGVGEGRNDHPKPENKRRIPSRQANTNPQKNPSNKKQKAYKEKACSQNM